MGWRKTVQGGRSLPLAVVFRISGLRWQGKADPLTLNRPHPSPGSDAVGSPRFMSLSDPCPSPHPTPAVPGSPHVLSKCRLTKWELSSEVRFTLHDWPRRRGRRKFLNICSSLWAVSRQIPAFSSGGNEKLGGPSDQYVAKFQLYNLKTQAINFVWKGQGGSALLLTSRAVQRNSLWTRKISGS